MTRKIEIPFDVVQKIRRMHKPGVVGYRVLSKEFGIAESTIRDICTYRTRMSK